MIDLAPGHKLGLIVANPVLLAAGIIGLGEATHNERAMANLGGVVVGPVRRGGQAGLPAPRLAETSGGFVLNGSEQNRALSAVLKRFARLWPRLGCPVVVQLADRDPHQLAIVAEQLSTVAGVSAFELLVPDWADDEWLERAITAIDRHSDLPLWVKLPLATALSLAPVAQAAGAVGLVVGQALTAALARSPTAHASAPSEPAADVLVQGALYGPLTFAPMLAALLAVRRLKLGLALIACGGIHTLAQARLVLASGADALQVDSAAWIEPGLPVQLAKALGEVVG